MPRLRFSLLGLCTSLVVGAGCGGAAPKATPQAPPPAGEPVPQYAQPPPPQQPGYAPPSTLSPESDAEQPPAVAPAPPAEAAGPRGDTARPSLEQASLDFDRAASELSAAGNNCAQACKALDSMNRASEHICALEPHDGAVGRCRRARQRLAEARERVRRSCACP